ncbi:MAG: RNA polymerase sigma factor [Planctomycetales bacterium]|jgi:RNA polymerase sigma factor (sigma-70 family)
MPENSDTSTSITLLLRVQEVEDSEAWGRFVERYAPQVFAWCRRHKLQDSDAADVTQEVLTKLVRSMRSFAYDSSRGSFRGWLKTVTQNAIRDLIADSRKQGRGAGDTLTARLLEQISDETASAELEEQITAQYERELLEEAGIHVQARVKPTTWSAYHMTAVDQKTAADTAQSLNLPVSEIYVAKSRVIKMLREEVARLDSSGNSPYIVE